MIYIYGLFIKGACEYVGASADPIQRYRSHRGCGKFRKEYPALRIFRSCRPEDASRIERQVTLAYHRKGQAARSIKAGGYGGKAAITTPLLSDKAVPYKGELMDRKSFIAARYSLRLSVGFVASCLGIPCAELSRFERKETVLPFEMLGRYSSLIRNLSASIH